MLPHQEKVEAFYNSNQVQVLVACLIGLNFLTNIVEKEIDPQAEKHEDVFLGAEYFYNICFTIELMINLYGHWFIAFWKSRWNVFDVVVVSIGIINMLQLDLPPAFSMLRMMRAFRVFRLFKRVHSLNKIVIAIARAIPGVLNAFVILAIVMCIYAILAVEFYYEIGNDCKEVNGDSRFMTPRGGCAGEEYFGTFSKSLYSFFQVLTGESWSEMVARPAIWFFYDDPIRALGSGAFFVSYVLITAFVLTNVVVAVLLEKMVDPDSASAAQAVTEEALAAAEGDGTENGDATERSGDTIRQNGVEISIEKMTPDMFQKTVTSVSSQVEQLVSDSDKMSSELDTFRSDMAALREQVADVIRCIPGSYDKEYQTR